MAFTILTLESDIIDIPRVWVDRTDEGIFVLKQDDGDWIALTPQMLRDLSHYVIREGV